MAEAKKKETFESAIAKLEKIAAALEEGEAPLDKSLQMYEEGIRLIRFCTESLDKAEQSIKIITKKADGEYVEEDFSAN